MPPDDFGFLQSHILRKTLMQSTCFDTCSALRHDESRGSATVDKHRQHGYQYTGLSQTSLTPVTTLARAQDSHFLKLSLKALSLVSYNTGRMIKNSALFYFVGAGVDRLTDADRVNFHLFSPSPKLQEGTSTAITDISDFLFQHGQPL